MSMVIRLSEQCADEISNGMQCNYMKTLLDCAAVGILVVSSDRIILDMNQCFCEWVGYSFEELLGKSVAMLHTDQQSYEDFGVMFRTALETGRQLQIEYSFRLQDDSISWVLLSGSSIRLPDGLQGVVWSVLDITERKKAEETLLLEQYHQKQIFEYNGTGNMIVDDNRIITRVNRKFCQMLGYTEDELLGQSVQMLHIDQQHYENWAPNFRQVHTGLTYIEAEYPIRHKDGSRFWCLFNGSRLRLQTGETLVIWSLIDITERKNRQQAMAMLNYALDSISEAAFMPDSGGKFVYVNQEAIRSTGYSRDELLSKSVSDIDTSITTERWPEILSHLKEEGSLSFEAVHTTKDGKQFPVELRATYFEFESQAYTLGLARDITERKQVEQEIKAARLQAEAANEAKSQFLANMSHELRTPLHGIISMVHLLSMTSLTKEQTDYVETIEVLGRNLIDLISDILDISRIEAGKLVLERTRFSLKNLIDEVVQAQVVSIRQKDLSLKLDLADDLPQQLMGDPLRVKQIIMNLLGNAVKFTQQGSVEISARVVEATDDNILLHLSIKDTGIGMSEEILSRIFSPFVQADSSTTRKFGGSGLGLAICKRLVAMMDGCFWAESTAGVGSTFHLELSFGLPGQIIPLEKPARRVEIKSDLKPLKILLAEDNEINASSLIAILEKLGHQAVHARDGQQAVEKWGKERFDCILMDIQMPVMDGAEAVQKIRQKEQLTDSHIPIIALTAHALQGDREKFLSQGFDAYLPKPMEVSQLLDELARVGKDINAR